MDSFYKVLNEKQREVANRNEYNFDHPDAFDLDLLGSTLQRLKEGRKVEVPIYNFVTHARESRTVRFVEFIFIVVFIVFIELAENYVWGQCDNI